MAFRHFVRHAYRFEIEATAIHKIIEQCPALVMCLKREIMVAIDEREPETNGEGCEPFGDIGNGKFSQHR